MKMWLKSRLKSYAGHDVDASHGGKSGLTTIASERKVLCSAVVRTYYQAGRHEQTSMFRICCRSSIIKVDIKWLQARAFMVVESMSEKKCADKCPLTLPQSSQL